MQGLNVMNYKPVDASQRHIAHNIHFWAAARCASCENTPMPTTRAARVERYRYAVIEGALSAQFPEDRSFCKTGPVRQDTIATRGAVT